MIFINTFQKRISAFSILFVFIFAIIILRYWYIATESEYGKLADEYGKYEVKVESGEGYIYDRNFIPLVNETEKYITVTANTENTDNLSENAENYEEYCKLCSTGKPFAFESKNKTEDNVYTTTFEIPERYNENQIAQHLIGYTSNGEGVSGLEYAYDRILRNNEPQNSVIYNCDGFGQVMLGEGKTVRREENQKYGVVTTIDYDIQKICEKAGEDIEKGAIIVTEVKTGDILAMASFPEYSIENLGACIEDERSPLINRCFYSYSIGSVFKLVTACEAIKSGYADFTYNCVGSVDVFGKNFRCHDHSGHGEQDIIEAMTNSCNTYFIELSKKLDVESFRDTAFSLGFGREIQLFAGGIASTGVLPTVKELSVPAELANFSFGQGKLSATPLHISQLTCAIANNGKMPVLRVIKGLTSDGKTVGNEKKPQLVYAMEEETAEMLRTLMAAAVNNNENSNARPYNVMAAGKTSTAQTGRFDENGNELYNAWITGYFPVYEPEYAVTVLIEDGGYGNDSSAPVFREIIEKIQKIKKSD
ncbi:MAG: penicillin-binding protein 2 [Ruminococcus sp.]|nr:penicillin-binding protein 2 [Ruminococcus sp.]